MAVDTYPLRWPASWESGMMSLLQGGPFTVLKAGAAPAEGAVVRGLWPGIRVSPSGGDRAAAGPTGEPWVDSNGWRIRVAKLRSPGVPIWVDAKPNPSRISAEDYVLGFADVAAHGGKWIVTLDDALASGIAAKQAEAMDRWKRITEAAQFFRSPESLAEQAVIGVLSMFSGPKVGFTDEVLNNLARTKQQYRAIFTGRAAFEGLKGLIYTDPVEPPAAVRKSVMEFVNAGGMLITGPAWGSLPKGEAQRSHPRYAIRGVGQGSMAVATGSFADPYLVANDAVTLVSHRNDVVRFFNTGAITPCLASKAGGAVLQTVFYSLRPVEDATVWVKGTYKSARMLAFGQAAAQPVKLRVRDAGVEVNLPAVSQYARIELES
jgi:hypothetical protein